MAVAEELNVPLAIKKVTFVAFNSAQVKKQDMAQIEIEII
jgi:hypothetical protein